MAADMNELPTLDEVETYIKRAVQRRMPFVTDSSLIGVSKTKNHPAKFVRFKKRADAIKMHQRVLSKFNFPRKIRKVGKGKDGRWFFLNEEGKQAVSATGFNTMMDAVRRDTPDLFYDVPVRGDYVISLGRKKGGATPLKIMKVANNFDPEDHEDADRESGGLKRSAVVFNGALDHEEIWTPYKPGKPRLYDETQYEMEKPLDKITGPGVWDVLKTVLGKDIPLEVSVWIRSPSIKFQRVSDIGEAPTAPPVDIRNIKLSDKQTSFLRALVDEVIESIESYIGKFHKYDALNDTETTQFLIEQIAKKRRLKDTINPVNAFEKAGLKKGTAPIKRLEDKGLLTFSESTYHDYSGGPRTVLTKMFHIKLRPEVLTLLNMELPPVPTPMPDDQRRTTEQIVADVLIKAAGQAARRGVNSACAQTRAGKGLKLDIETGTHEMKEGEDYNAYDATLTYPKIISTTIKYQVDDRAIKNAIPDETLKLYEDAFTAALAKGYTPAMVKSAHDQLIDMFTNFGINNVYDIHWLYKDMDYLSRDESEFTFDVDDEKYPNLEEEWPKVNSLVTTEAEDTEVPLDSVHVTGAPGDRGLDCEFDIRRTMKVVTAILKKAVKVVVPNRFRL